MLASLKYHEVDYLGHTVRVVDGEVLCNTCSVPKVIADVILFMATQPSIRVLKVDGQEIISLL